MHIYVSEGCMVQNARQIRITIVHRVPFHSREAEKIIIIIVVVVVVIICIIIHTCIRIFLFQTQTFIKY